MDILRVTFYVRPGVMAAEMNECPSASGAPTDERRIFGDYSAENSPSAEEQSIEYFCVAGAELVTIVIDASGQVS